MCARLLGPGVPFPPLTVLQVNVTVSDGETVVVAVEMVTVEVVAVGGVIGEVPVIERVAVALTLGWEVEVLCGIFRTIVEPPPEKRVRMRSTIVIQRRPMMIVRAERIHKRFSYGKFMGGGGGGGKGSIGDG